MAQQRVFDQTPWVQFDYPLSHPDKESIGPPVKTVKLSLRNNVTNLISGH